MFLNCARREFALVVRLAYSSEHAPLLKTIGENTISDGVTCNDYVFADGADTVLNPSTRSYRSLEFVALSVATKRNQHEIVRLLIEKGVDVNSAATGSTYETLPLYTSVHLGDLRTAQFLLANEADPNAYTSPWKTPALFGAVEAYVRPVTGRLWPGTEQEVQHASKSAVMTKLLLANQADISIKARFDMTVLCFAAKYGRPETIQSLLKAGAYNQLEGAPTFGGRYTPLMIASKKRHGAAVKLLLTSGADIKARSPVDASDALILAIQGDEQRWDHQSSPSTIKLLLENGADPNGGGGHQLPLCRAICYGNYLAVDLLLAAGADVGRQGDDGRTALDIWLAVRTGHWPLGGAPITWVVLSRIYNDAASQMLGALIESGAALDRLGPSGLTPMNEICSSRGLENEFRPSVIRAFLQHGADVNKSDVHGNTPLICACKNTDITEDERLEIIMDLQSYDADTELVNHEGDTALMAASVNTSYTLGDCRSIRALICDGASVYQRSTNGNASFTLACNSKNLSAERRSEVLGVLDRELAKLELGLPCVSSVI